MNSVFSVSAAGDMPRLADEADLLSAEQKRILLDELNEISERQKVDIVVVTVNSLGRSSPMEFADDFYDDHDYGFGSERDGILLLISMEERDWYISTAGYGITAVTDAGWEYISERVTDDLSEGDYVKAFTTYAVLCDDFITQARSGTPYDVGNLPKKPFRFALHFAITFGIGFVIALIVTGMMMRRLKTVESRWAADDYVRPGGMRLTKRNDLFLYHRVLRRERPKENRSYNSGGPGTHRSSSGRRHGGGGGKF